MTKNNLHRFPERFIWGTATAGHQIEGNNKNCDWWAWETHKTENDKYPLEPSGLACASYDRYEEDFDLCVKLSNSAVRIGIEWARIEPEEGKFDQNEIEHYKNVLLAAKSRKLKTFVTLHHFTNPLWFAKKGGWLNTKSPKYFYNYSKKCAQEFGSLIDYYLTINEPQVLALQSYTNGTWPPCHKNYFESFFVQINLMRAHNASYDAIKSVADYPVGIVKNIMWVYAADDGIVPFIDALIAKFVYFLNSGFFLIPIKNHLDLIGVNYYFTNRIKNLARANLDDRMSDLNWWIVPWGLEKILIDLKKYKLPIYITENGVADSTDSIRKEFIEDMLGSVHNAIAEGANVKGYFHWSLIDNYEWHQGFWPKFGLVYIDRENNLNRVPRDSFYYYAEICKNNAF